MKEKAGTGYESDLTVGRVSVHVARNQPRKIALDDGHRRLTYSDLHIQVERMALALVRIGISKGDVISAYLPNCIDYVMVVLAVSRAGAVFSPINPRFKAYEIARLIKMSRPRVVFTTSELAGTLADAREIAGAGESLISICVDGKKAEVPKTRSLDWLLRKRTDSLPEIREGDFFSLMFTSGTTGDPKGVLATHRARMLWVLNAAIQYGLNEDDVYLGTMPQVHSAGLTFTLMHLYVGAKVRILEHFDPTAFLEIVEKDRVTSSLTVPTMLAMVLEELEKTQRPYSLESLKRIVTCGSPLSLVTKKRVIEKISDQLYDYYGSTESNSMTVLRPRDQLRKSSSVGQPFNNVEIMIAGPDGASLPKKEIGEVCCANPSVMTCYLDRPEETRAAFTDGWFHTGDLGYLDEDGYLHLVGRGKDTIISGGINIYPAEIERVLLQHHKILDCAVIGVPDAKWGQAVKAFVTVSAGSRIDLAEVQEHCEKYLAGYKKPRHLEVVADIPKNASGKTIKAALLQAPQASDRERNVHGVYTHQT